MSTPLGLSSAAATPPASQNGGRPKLEHAYLELRNPPPKPGSLEPGTALDRIDFQFNPKELTLSKSAAWKRDSQKKSKTSSVPQYQGPEPSKMTLEMFLDASDTQTDKVVTTVEKLFACCAPTDATHSKKKGAPPLVIFHWGAITGFTAYIKSVSVKYSLFTAGGLPIRGTATVNLEEMAPEPGRQNPTSGGLAARAVHTVVAGDSLASIAWHEYGDPSLWRPIAERNGIDDPMRLPVGTTLLIPAAEEIGM